jgi:hypothetical protein
LKDLTDPLTLAEEGTSVTNKKVMEQVFRAIRIAKITPFKGIHKIHFISVILSPLLLAVTYNHELYFEL